LSRTVPGCPGEACPASPGNLEILKISFFGHLWSRLVIFRACPKMDRGCFADQPQHLAIAKTPENSRPAAAGRGRPAVLRDFQTRFHQCRYRTG